MQRHLKVECTEVPLIRETERYHENRGFGKLSKQTIFSDQTINSHGSYITCLIIQAQRFGDT